MYTIYSKPACPHCTMAKALLENLQEPHRVIHLDVGQPKVDGEIYVTRSELLEKIPHARTMPQIIQTVDTQEIYVGGFEELRQHLRPGTT